MPNEIKGFYKVWRRSRKHWLWNLKPYDEWHAWEYLISWAAFVREERMYQRQLHMLERGQHVTTKNQLHEDWGWGWSRVNNFLKMLSKAGMLVEGAERGCIVLTLCNYDLWQSEGSRAGNQRRGRGEVAGNPRRDRVERDKKSKKLKKRKKGVAPHFGSTLPKEPKDFTPGEARKAIQASEITKIPFSPEVEAIFREKAKQSG